MLSPRNQIEVAKLHPKQIEDVDTLYEICNAEFNSRSDVHSDFDRARGPAGWARHYLLHEVRNVAMRENMYCTYHMAFVVATKLSEVWFENRELA